MALDYSLNNIKNWQTTCFYIAPQDRPNRGIKAGQEVINPVTQVLIMATMFIGIPEITDRNAEQFYARLRLWESCERLLVGDNPITPRMVLDHIGLKTNAMKKNDQQFAKDLLKLALTVSGIAMRDAYQEEA